MRYIIHLDVNSFFATVEQQINPWLRGKAIGVGGRPGSRSIVAAASYEAKARGIVTAMSTTEALAMCPELILVTGDNRRYHAVSRQIITVLLSFTPDVEVFSVDECFADITNLVGTAGWQRAVEVVVAIKAALRQQVGEWLSCSVGLAENKFLAKLGSDTFKPNGLHVIADETGLRAPTTGTGGTRLLVESADALILRVELEAFCGLGPRLGRHLRRLGIHTTAQLRQADPLLLTRIFGVNGRRLWEWSWGVDDRPLAVHWHPSVPKSITRSITLPPQLDTPTTGERYLYDLCEKVAWELRRQQLGGRRLFTWVGFTDRTGWGGHAVVPSLLDDSAEIYRLAKGIYSRRVGFKPVRQVGVGLELLSSTQQQTLSWLPEDQQRAAVGRAQDLVRERFGAKAVHRASWLLIAGQQAEAAHAFGFRFSE